MKTGVAMFLLALAAAPTLAAEAPPWLSGDDVATLREGRGSGMAKVAEAHGWPGPKHALELGADLRLDDAQRAALEVLMATMHDDAAREGAAVIDAEAALDAELSGDAPDVARIRTLAANAGAARGRLRAVHVTTHVAAAKVLSEEQRKRYVALRAAH